MNSSAATSSRRPWWSSQERSVASSFSAVEGRTSASGASAAARRSASASGSAPTTSAARLWSVSTGADVCRSASAAHRPVVGRPCLQPGPGRPDDRVAIGEHLQQPGPRASLHVRHHDHGQTLLGQRRLARGQRPARHQPEHRPHLRLRQQHGGEGTRRDPVGPLGRVGQRVDGLAAQQPDREPVEVVLPHPPGGLELVGVTGDGGRRELVDVGEDQFGEGGDGLRRHAGGHRRGGELAPRHPRPHPVGRQQRVGRAARPGLAPAQGVRALHRGGQRGAGVGGAGGDAEEAPERHLHGLLDGRGELVAEALAVGRHLLAYGRDGVLSDVGERAPQQLDEVMIESVAPRRWTHVVISAQKMRRHSRL